MIKQHDLNSPSHSELHQEQEMNSSLTIPDNFLAAVHRYADLPFLSYRAGFSTSSSEIQDHYNSITYNESLIYVNDVVNLLLSSGAQKGERCVIYSKNSPLWLLTDLAIAFTGCISAFLYDTLGLDNIAFCINQVKAKYIFVSSEYIANVIAIIERIPSVKTIFIFDTMDRQKVKQKVHQIVAQSSDDNIVIQQSDSQSSFAFSNKAVGEVVCTVAQDKVQNNLVDYKLYDELIDKDSNDCVKIVQLKLSAVDSETTVESELNLKNVLKNANITSKDILSVTFTSGTVGLPKGVLATHENFIEGVACHYLQFVPYHLSKKGEQSRTISYLPLAHVFERAVEHASYCRGYNTFYFSGNVKNLLKDLELAKPTFMIGVPRIFCKIYNGILQKIKELPKIMQKVFFAALAAKKFYLKHSKSGQSTGHMPIVDHVFSKITKNLGGAMEFMVSGSSALPEDVRTFLEATTCSCFVTGYGVTEALVAGTYNYYMQKYNSSAQLGFAGKYIQAIVIDRSDASEFSFEKDRIGELCLKGNCISIGYIDGEWGKVKKLVDENGFYHTGDLVKLNEDGSASFIRRVGLVVKLQQGEFVDLEAIAQALEAMPLVMQAFVHGEADKTAPVCFVSVDSNVLSEKLGKEVVDKYKTDDSNAAKLIEQYVYEQGELAVRRAGLKGFNVPKAYQVFLDVDWSINPDYYTPSQKKKNSVFIKLNQKYMQVLWSIASKRQMRSDDREDKVDKIGQKQIHKQGQGRTMLIALIITVVLMLIARFV